MPKTVINLEKADIVTSRCGKNIHIQTTSPDLIITLTDDAIQELIADYNGIVAKEVDPAFQPRLCGYIQEGNQLVPVAMNAEGKVVPALDHLPEIELDDFVALKCNHKVCGWVVQIVGYDGIQKEVYFKHVVDGQTYTWKVNRNEVYITTIRVGDWVESRDGECHGKVIDVSDVFYEEFQQKREVSFYNKCINKVYVRQPKELFLISRGDE